MSETIYLVIERPELAYYLSKGMPTPMRTLDPCLIDYLPPEYFSKFNEKPEDLFLSYSISTDIRKLTTKADSLARDFEYGLCTALNLLSTPLLLPNFQQFGLANIIAQIDIYKSIAHQISAQMEWREVIIPSLFEPGRDYRPSWIPSMTLVSTLGEHGVLAKPEFFALQRTEPRLYPDYLTEYAFPKGYLTFLFGNGLHNDVEFLTSSINRENSVQLRSGEWDTLFKSLPQAPFISGESLLKRFEELSPEVAKTSAKTVTEHLDQLFHEVSLDHRLIARQKEATSQRYLEQIALYHTLDSSSWPTPDMVIAGMHPALAVAPTLYFFAQHAVGLMYHFPHSKLINQKFAVNYGTQLTHPCSTKEEVANAINPGIEKIAVIYPESREVVLRDAGPLKIIGILLNKLSGDGYLVTDLKALRGFYHRLAEVAINRGIELSVRDKPFGTCTRVLSGLLELDSSTLLSNTWRRLEDYLGTCDMILMFDSPTSACLSALSLGVPIVHVEFRPLADSEAALCPACIPSWNPDFCLLKITEFDTNADLLAEFKRNQQYAYLRGISSGRSLRSILGAKAGP